MPRLPLLVCLLVLLPLTACQRDLPTPAQPAALQGVTTPTTAASSRAPASTAGPTSIFQITPTRGPTLPPRITPTGPVAPERLDGPTPTPEPLRDAFTIYTVKAGDTLGGISARLDIPLADIIKANGITDPNRVQVGQQLKIPAKVDIVAPAERMLPDSEVVYGPPAAGFDVERFAQSQSGYLKEHQENVEGRVRTGPEIVQLVAQRYSVSPRVLLALIELKGEWLSNPAPSDTAKTYPVGRIDPGRPRLYYQLTWAANQINEGYYGWKSRQLATLTYQGGSRARLTPGLNPGTYGLQFMLAQLAPPDGFLPLVAREGEFMRVYLRLFGDPASRAVEPLVPADLKQPELRLPWPAGDRWFFTGGPHGAWGSGSAWAALDFIPGTANLGGCWDASAYWVTAVAAGVVVRSEDGEVMVDLDGDGKETTGWNILYMHVASRDRVAVGTRLKMGDRIGHPSCEGGFSTGTHLHIVRKYNGEWIPATGPIPFTLSGWTVTQGGQEYDGAMSRGGETREACECRVEETNGLLSDNR